MNSRNPDLSELEHLTSREREVLTRIADGYSDLEIARELFLSVNTVKWHNRNIYAKLGAASRTQAISVAADWGILMRPVFRDPASDTEQIHNLPSEISSFIGRKQEINNVKKLLQSTRLLTLTGPGGVGKTRLALRVAADLARDKTYCDGIYLIELAPLNNPDWVAGAIVEGLGLFPFAASTSVDQLEYYLADKKMLLVIDNFEHVIEAANLVSRLLSSSPGLKILVTSRQILNLTGEQIYIVPPLVLPDLDKGLPLEKLSGVESVALFLDRAQELLPGVKPSIDDLQAIGQICTSLDGLPLAIELAAARINVIPPGEMVSKLEDRFQLLKGGPRDADEKHQSLQRALDWSYDLLSSDEKKLFYRLGVFQGEWSIEAVEEICIQDLDLHVLDGLDSLLAKSLIQQAHSSTGEARFFMLETVHTYARQRLEETPEIDHIQKKHARFFGRLAQQAREPLRDGWDTILWLDRLEADHENLRAAFAWSLQSNEIEVALRLVGDLPDYWVEQGYYQEGKKWIERALEFIDLVPVQVQAMAYFAAGYMNYYLGQLSESKKMLEEALPLFHQLDDRISIGYTYLAMADTACGNADDDPYFREHIKQALDVMQDLDHKPGIHSALTDLGVHEAITGRYPQARECYEQAIILARELGQEIRESVNLVNYGGLIMREGNDPLAAYRKLKQSLGLLREIGYKSPHLKAGILSYCACAAVELGKIENAVVLFSASDALFSRKGFRCLRESEPLFEKNKQKTRSLLDDADFQRAWSLGETLSAEEAITYALEEVSPQ